MTNELKVTNDLVVGMDYILRLEDGQIIDRSEKGDPLHFLQGHNQIIPGLESALVGMAVGDEKDVVIQPADGYGEYDEEDQEELPKTAFPDDMELEVGMDLYVRDQQNGKQYQAFVQEIRSDSVLLDFNHPLAGKSLHFHVKITDLRAATAEELAHGHAH